MKREEGSTDAAKPQMGEQVSQLVQFRIVEKPYEVEVPKYVTVEIEKPVYVEKEYVIPVIKEKVYEKPVINEKQMTADLTLFIKDAIGVAINNAISNLKFTFDLPMPRVMKVDNK